MYHCFSRSRVTKILSRVPLQQLSKTIQQRLLNISCQVEQLTSRSLIRVNGNEVTNFLQGIATNDIKHLQDGSKSLFTMFLNTKGRVLYDSIIYKTNVENTFLVECDSTGVQDLIKHLKTYRVRRKIDIDSVDDSWKVWVLFNPREVDTSNNNAKSIKQEQVVPCTVPNFNDNKKGTFLNEIILDNDSSVYADPRLSSLGSRVIARVGENITQAVQNAGVKVESKSTQWSYRMFRYRLGVGEGTEELPIGKCFPLEANCDYLHGVSFHKGCYIGQELTARTHHTGVVRKRLMPLVLNCEVEPEEFPVDTAIEFGTTEKKAIGKLRGLEKDSALGLMRIAEALEINKFKIKNVGCETMKPFWWPQELSKERKESGSRSS